MRRLSWEQRDGAETRRKRAFKNKLKRKQKKYIFLLEATIEERKSKTGYIPSRSFKNPVRIVLPKNFSLQENYNETIDKIFDLREFALQKHRNVKLHFGKVENVDISAILVLVAEIYRCENLSRDRYKVHGDYPKDHLVELYLQLVGFFDLLKIKNRKKFDEEQVPFKLQKFMTDTRADGNWINKLRKNLFGDIINEDLNNPLYDALIEAMTNVGHHAYPDGTPNPYPVLSGRWWMFGSRRNSDDILTATFFDQGVGIPETAPLKFSDIPLGAELASLKEKGEYAELIHAIITHGRDTARPRGNGLRDMAQLVDQFGKGSRLKIISGHGEYIYFPNQTQKPSIKNLRSSIGGTLIEWQVPIKSLIENKG